MIARAFAAGFAIGLLAIWTAWMAAGGNRRSLSSVWIEDTGAVRIDACTFR